MSLCICCVTPSFCVVAAEGRVTQRGIAVADDSEKIIPCGHGIVLGAVGLWSVHACLAEEVSSLNQDETWHSIHNHFASMERALTRLLPVVRESVERRGLVESVALVGFDRGAQRMRGVLFCSTRSFQPVDFSVRRFCVMGHEPSEARETVEELYRITMGPVQVASCLATAIKRMAEKYPVELNDHVSVCTIVAPAGEDVKPRIMLERYGQPKIEMT